MILSLNPDVQKRIDEWVNSGKYSSPEDVVAAALLALDQQERFGDFDAGELDNLLAEGERSIALEGTLDGDEAFRQRHQRRAEKRSPAP
jgi:Arc/MetJ-type ribon-helix-helix transcriptional regulator